MNNEEIKKKYYQLFNQTTDILRIMETIRDECVVMEAVPEYDPAAQPLGGKTAPSLPGTQGGESVDGKVTHKESANEKSPKQAEK